MPWHVSELLLCSVCSGVNELKKSMQVSSGFKDYVLAPAYPDGYLPTPAYKDVSVICSGYCK